MQRMYMQRGYTSGILQVPEFAAIGGDAYGSGGQNYYAAGWQNGAEASVLDTPGPAKESGSAWGKLGFWGGSQAAEGPKPARDQGVLYFGTQQVCKTC